MNSDVKEPVFNAPWPALLLGAGLIAGLVWQTQAVADADLAGYAISASAIRSGRDANPPTPTCLPYLRHAAMVRRYASRTFA